MKISKIAVLTLFTLSTVVGCAQKKEKKSKKDKKNKTEMTLDTQLDSVSYSLGINIAENMKTQGIENLNLDALKAGMNDVFTGSDIKITQEEAGQILNSYMQEMQKVAAEKQQKEGADFLIANAKKGDVISLPSGLQYKIITEGNGAIPGPTDKVTTHYHGMLINGEVFDSSIDRGQPASFPVNGVIKGWTEALLIMPTGSKWQLYIPYDLAYGAQGAGGKIGPYATLIFDIELISIDQ